jgi:hypothetical protein
MPKMHSKVSLETKNQVLQEVPKTIFMTPICVRTNIKGLELFFKSMELYLPEGVLIYLASPSKPYLTPSPYKWIPNTYGSFGEAYNACMREAFLDGHQEVIIANDDIVLDPDSYTKLLTDRELLKAKGIKVGFLGARTNMSQPTHEREEPTARRSVEWHEVVIRGGYGAGAVDCSDLCISGHRRMAGVPTAELVFRQCCLP